MTPVKNLSQLKKALASGHHFRILAHYKHPEWTGQERYIKYIGSNMMYTGLVGKPSADISMMNDGKGCYFNFGKASDWTFKNGVCRYDHIWTIQVI